MHSLKLTIYVAQFINKRIVAYKNKLNQAIKSTFSVHRIIISTVSCFLYPMKKIASLLRSRHGHTFPDKSRYLSPGGQHGGWHTEGAPHVSSLITSYQGCLPSHYGSHGIRRNVDNYGYDFLRNVGTELTHYGLEPWTTQGLGRPWPVPVMC